MSTPLSSTVPARTAPVNTVLAPLSASSKWVTFAITMMVGLVHSVLMVVMFAPLGWWPASLVAVVPLFLLAEFAGRSDPAVPSPSAPSILERARVNVRHARARWLGLFAWASALPFWIVNQWWITGVSTPGAPILMLIEASWTGLFIGLAVTILRRTRVASVFVLPLLWTAIEFFRGDLFGHGYSWSLIAYPLIDCIPLAAPAALGGVYLVSLLTSLFAAGLVALLTRKRAHGIAALAVWLASASSAWLLPTTAKQTAPADNPKFSVAAIQTNVLQGTKLTWTFEQELEEFESFTELTIRAATGLPSLNARQPAAMPKPDLIIWPETMMPGITLELAALDVMVRDGIYFRQATTTGESQVRPTIFAELLAELSAAVKTPMLIGEESRINLRTIITQKEVDFSQDARYNSVYLYVAGVQSQQRYDKVRLTPFGETMPYIASIPGLQQKLLDLGAKGMQFDLSEGQRDVEFVVPLAATPDRPLRCVSPICFEITVGPYSRHMVYGSWPGGKRRADLIVNVTNDGWFGTFDSTRAQHLQIARWRAIELATPIIRSANTGISASIDARGQFIDSLPPREEGILLATFPRPIKSSLYGIVGDIVPWSTLLATLLLSFLPRKFGKLRTSPPAVA